MELEDGDRAGVEPAEIEADAAAEINRPQRIAKRPAVEPIVEADHYVPVGGGVPRLRDVGGEAQSGRSAGSGFSDGDVGRRELDGLERDRPLTAGERQE